MPRSSEVQENLLESSKTESKIAYLSPGSRKTVLRIQGKLSKQADINCTFAQLGMTHVILVYALGRV